MLPTTPHSAWSFDAVIDACEEMRLANMKVRVRAQITFVALDGACSPRHCAVGVIWDVRRSG